MTWQRARSHERCGRCDRLLTANDPVRVLNLSGVHARRIRCDQCSDIPVNVDELETFDVAEDRRASFRVVAPAPGFTRVTAIARAAFDMKAAAAGDKE